MKTRCTRSDVWRGVVALLAVAAAAACSGPKEASPPTPAAAEPPIGKTVSPIEQTGSPIEETASPYDALPDGVRNAMGKPFTGDFDAMLERRAIRVAVTFNRTHYFIDK